MQKRGMSRMATSFLKILVLAFLLLTGVQSTEKPDGLSDGGNKKVFTAAIEPPANIPSENKGEKSKGKAGKFTVGIEPNSREPKAPFHDPYEKRSFDYSEDVKDCKPCDIAKWVHDNLARCQELYKCLEVNVYYYVNGPIGPVLDYLHLQAGSNGAVSQNVYLSIYDGGAGEAHCFERLKNFLRGSSLVEGCVVPKFCDIELFSNGLNDDQIGQLVKCIQERGGKLQLTIRENAIGFFRIYDIADETKDPGT